MHMFRASSKNRVEGIAFTIPELLLVTAWAEFHNLRLSIELDWHVDQTEYEEVITLGLPGRIGSHCLLWRSADSIVLQPMVGRARRFTNISDALDAICPEQV